ncbi:hypothetical protein B0H17DRAFT_1064001 [Mycena rosella]|uniref:Uncharacterized protein n=1 Tax=Mycena rosella TaxID=1033263 RepID=A0AAD7GE90_MYCRO|nr:hypothetical protein B0H17DRAFT_1064001 [Mycena rosella]
MAVVHFSGFLKCVAAPVIRFLVPSGQFWWCRIPWIRPPSALPAFLLLHPCRGPRRGVLAPQPLSLLYAVLTFQRLRGSADTCRTIIFIGASN